MDSKRNGNKWVLTVLFLALASFTTMGFTGVDRGAREVAIVADHVPCTFAELNVSYVPQDLVNRICLDAEITETVADFETFLNADSSVRLVTDGAVWFEQYSAVWFEQYSAVLAQADQLWNEWYVADNDSQALFEQYNAALAQADQLWTEQYRQLANR